MPNFPEFVTIGSTSNTEEIRKLLLEEKNSTETNNQNNSSDNSNITSYTQNQSGIILDILSYQGMQNIVSNNMSKTGNSYSIEDDETISSGSANFSSHQEPVNNKDAKSLLSEWIYFSSGNFDESKITDIKKTADGKITDFYYDGERYSFRYDENGNLTKTFKQYFDNNGNIVGQQVKNYNADGSLKNDLYYQYDYDENGNQVQTSREAYDGKYGSYNTLLINLFGKEPSPCGMFHSLEPIKVTGKTQDGKVTDFTDRNGTRYSVRYDENGNVTKTIVQTFDDNGKIKTQDITNIDKNGVTIKESHTYDENGVDNTPESMQATNRVRKLYTSKTGDLSKSQDARSKFYKFIENKTIEKLSAAGVSRDDILNLFDELFPNAMNWLLNDMGDSETARYLHNKYGILYPEYAEIA